MIPVLLIVLAPIIGGLVYGFERVVKARMQRRIGPPLLQPFYDFLKLADKRKMIVHSAHAFLGIMHFVSLWFALGVLLLGGDLILVIFLHLLSTALIILAGYSTRSVFSHLGANRTAISVLAYEPVLIIIAVSIFMITGTFETGAVYLWDEPLLYKMPLAFVALLLILPIKLKKSPFDVAEAHQEVTGGVELEFSGLFYEAVYTAKWLDYVFCYTLVFLFAGSNILLGIGLIVFTFFYLNALDNSSARVNYKQMLRFSLGVAFSLAFINLLINILS
ncbi:MAG: NADH-quinone oxidoreductase subunit H [Chitinophagaceae bacterium]|nr:NADH-quinone oxidoreductase subunit H [Chitinophagaceae bacterium]MBK8952704.1 NADH-quinone oxidoreductase subunit H [Chitinophagaceae bacterium]